MLAPDPKRHDDEPLHPRSQVEYLAIRELLELPHYALVRAVARQLEDRGVDALAELLDAVVTTSASRGALIVADLYGFTKRSSLKWGELVERCKSRPSWGAMEEVLRDLPTIDAHEFRTQILNHDRRESSLQALSMVTHLRGNFSGDFLEPFGFVCYSRLVSADEGRDTSLGALLEASASKRYNPVTSPAQLEGRSRALCDEFRLTIQEEHFPAAKYGYGAHAGQLALEMPKSFEKDGVRYQALGGVAGEAQRLLSSRMNARVKVLWPETLDVPSSIGHQCIDSASSARSFFVERGVPADVYLIQMGALYHNVCVAFPPEQGRLTPVVVDASPFGGAYPLAGEGRPGVWRPQLIENVYKVRSAGLPLVASGGSGIFGYRGDSPSGFLPWMCQDIPEGRAIIFAGVVDEPRYFARCLERGTDEFYGQGERIRSLGFSVTLIPSPGEKSPQTLHHLTVKWTEGAFEIMKSSEGLTEGLKTGALGLLRGELPRLQETLDRLKVPVGSVTW